MPDEPRNTFRYRILRYAPNLLRDEWVNIGVVIEETGVPPGSAGPRRAARLIEEGQIARVRRLHPGADEELLRALPEEFDSRLRGPASNVAAYLEKLDQTLSNALQFSPQRAVLADDFDAELDRLFREQVAPPRRMRGGIVESTRAWIKERVNAVFLRRRVPQLQRNIPVEEFTQPGDTLKLDYGFQNGVRGYLHAVTLGRDPSQAKVLAYTAERVRLRLPGCEFHAITEAEPAPGKPRHQFIQRLFDEQDIAIVPLNRIEKFAEDLRLRLQ
ncbi:MAG TPA: DUF3037 domain-containing protein [Candidatus Acidoferrales bacterium]|nr:DUF3037 domain-containing protein [Candidatus Acidoferrales bacterium]